MGERESPRQIKENKGGVENNANQDEDESEDE